MNEFMGLKSTGVDWWFEWMVIDYPEKIISYTYTKVRMHVPAYL